MRTSSLAAILFRGEPLNKTHTLVSKLALCVSLSVLLCATAISWLPGEVAASGETCKSHSRGRHNTNPPLSRLLASAPLQAVISEIQLAFSTPHPHVNTDQSYPGIRTARMCRQPGCSPFYALAFPAPCQAMPKRLLNDVCISLPTGHGALRSKPVRNRVKSRDMSRCSCTL